MCRKINLNGAVSMKFELCGEDRLRITLARDDLYRASVSFDDLDYANIETRQIIWELLDEAERRTGFDCSAGRLLIEAVPLLDGGCVLLFSVLPDRESKTRRLHIRKLQGPFIYEFNEANDMLSAIARLSKECKGGIPKSALYLVDGKYRLIIYTKELSELPASLPAMLLSEYGHCTGQGLVEAARVAEYGKALAEEDAIKTVAAYLH